MKKRVLYAGLLLFTLWPLAHMFLAWKYGINPWKLAGWGMYATPRIMPAVGVLVRKSEGESGVPLAEVHPEIAAAAKVFQNRRLWLSQLVKPDRLAHLVLKHNPEYDYVTVFIVQPVLDRKTGMVRDEEETFKYRSSRSGR